MRLGRQPEDSELATLLGLTPLQVTKAYAAEPQPCPIDMLDRGGASFADTIADASDNPEKRALRVFDRTILDDVLRTLTPREADVLQLRFGLDERGDHTLEEIGQMLGVTRERIRQIEVKAIKKLRHPSRASRLGAALRKTIIQRAPEEQVDAAE